MAATPAKRVRFYIDAAATDDAVEQIENTQEVTFLELSDLTGLIDSGRLLVDGIDFENLSED